MKTDADNVRYSLENIGNTMLFVIGVNPSTATDKKADSTTRKGIGFAEHNGFDGFAIMNLYPLRSKNPYALPPIMAEELYQRNLAEIKGVIGNRSNPVILLAFGNSINAAPYLKKCLKDIVAKLQPLFPKWKQIGNLTKRGNPRHPSRAAYALKLQDFDMSSFLYNC